MGVRSQDAPSRCPLRGQQQHHCLHRFHRLRPKRPAPRCIAIAVLRGTARRPLASSFRCRVGESSIDMHERGRLVDQPVLGLGRIRDRRRIANLMCGIHRQNITGWYTIL